MPDAQQTEANIQLSDLDAAPDNIQSGAVAVHENYEKLLKRFAEVSDEKVRLLEENNSLKVKAKAAEILNNLIEPYAGKAYWFMCIYSAIVGVMLFLHGFSVREFNLPESVLGFLVGSTAVTVIGLVGMVLTGIFVGARSK